MGMRTLLSTNEDVTGGFAAFAGSKSFKICAGLLGACTLLGCGVDQSVGVETKQSVEAEMKAPKPTFPAVQAMSNYAGDNRSDFVYFGLDPTGKQQVWMIRPNGGGADVSTSFGGSSDSVVPGDYDGDGITDLAFFRPLEGNWYMRPSRGGNDVVTSFGVNTDRPVPADYDGDGKTDVAVFRPSVLTWYVRPSGGGSDIVTKFGAYSDILLPGDYDGDGKADYATFRPSEGKWHVRSSLSGTEIVTAFGTSTDRPVPGDYDGDRKTDLAFFHPADGSWHIRPSSGGADRVITFGVASDLLVPADYDGDGKADVAVFRPSTNTWYARPSGGGNDIVSTFGGARQVIPYSVLPDRIPGSQSDHDITSQTCSPWLWPHGKVYFELDKATVPPELEAAIRSAMSNWTAATSGRITFEENPSSPARIRFVSSQYQNCGLGYNGGIVTCQYYAMPPGQPYDTHAVSHEMGHGIGLSHEHIRYDRDRFVIVDDSAFTPNSKNNNYSDNWWKCGASDSGSDFGPFNYFSVMNYTSAPSSGYNLWHADGTLHVREPGVHMVEGSLTSWPTLQDQSNVNELYGYEWGWRKFVSLGRDDGSRQPLSAEMASGVVPSGAPALASQGGRGSLDLFVRGTNNHLYQRSASGGTWGSFVDLDVGPWDSDPAATSMGSGSRIVAIGRSKNVYLKEFTGGAWQKSWTNLSGPTGSGTACSAPVLASFGASTARVYVRACSNAIYYRARTALGSWSAWAALPGAPSGTTFTGKPAVAATATASYEVVLAATAGGLWHSVEGGTWTSRACCSIAGSSPSVVAGVGQRLDILFKDTNGIVSWEYREAGVWHGPMGVGGLPNSDLASVAGYRDHIDVISVLGDGVLWQRQFDRSPRFLKQDYAWDNRDDLVLFRPSEGKWYMQAVGAAANRSDVFGLSTDVLVPGDYDGDGYTDEAIFRPSEGNWYVRPTGGGNDIVMLFGVSSDQVVPGDYDGDGKTDYAIFRPSEGKWYVRPSGGGNDIVTTFGVSTDVLMPGDYDGDGKTDYAYFRPSEGKWYVRPSGGGSDIVTTFGTATDRPVAGDFDGDRRADYAYFRPSEGKWYVRPSGGGADIVTAFGVASDRLVPADYDNDGITDYCVFRPAEGNWYIRPSRGGGDIVGQFGTSSDTIPYSK
jgi:putative transposon-encoded protein